MVCVNSVSVSPKTLNLEVGQYGYPSASVSPSNATCKDVRWSSSNSDVASVNSTSGYVYAKAQGSATITARATDGSGKSDSLTVYVSEPSVVSVTSVTVTPGSMTLYVCDEAYASATVYPPNATNTSVTWNSENTSVARVNSSGKITAIGPGQTKVYATANDGSGKRDYVCVTVEDYVPVECITIEPETVTLTVGETATLTATICPTNATDKTVTWCNDNNNVIYINSVTGFIEAKMSGVAEVTAFSSDCEVCGSCTVIVNQRLTGADLYITDTNIIDTIINAKNMCDVAHDMYLDGKITYAQFQDIEANARYAADLARADYIVSNDQSDYAYQYFKGRNYQNGDVSPFTRNISYNESNPMTGLDVIVIQRGMQAIGYFEPDETYVYGTFDLDTYNASLSNNVLQNGVFDSGSYRVVFNSTNEAQRTPQWLVDLQEYSRQHLITQLALATLTGGEIEVGIKNGGPSGTHMGQADVLKKYSEHSDIWEVKHNNPNNLQLGNSQLQRYINAANSHPQDFATELMRGYNIPSFYIQYSTDTCLEIGSTSIKGLAFYNKIQIPDPVPDFTLVPLPNSQKEYEYVSKKIPAVLRDSAGALVNTICVAVAIVCIAGVIYLVFGSGALIPLVQGLSTLGTVKV